MTKILTGLKYKVLKNNNLKNIWSWHTPCYMVWYRNTKENRMTRHTIKTYRTAKRSREITYVKARAMATAHRAEKEANTLKARAWRALLAQGGHRCEQVFRIYFLGN